MHVESQLSLKELQQLERDEKDAGRSKRLRIIILAIEGWTAPAIAMSVGLSRRICQRWVRRDNDEGLAGLDDQRRTVSPAVPLSPEQVQQFRERLEAAYSPELNPVENLWHYLKSHFWSNRAYADYDALETAAIAAWRTAVLDAALMQSVCAAPYLNRASSEQDAYYFRTNSHTNPC